MTAEVNGEHLRIARDALWPELSPTYQIGPTRQARQRRAAQAIADAEERGRQHVLEVFSSLFSGEPDTPCRTTWRETPALAGDPLPATECVEVPIDELRATFDEAERIGA